ncbi:DUF4236 domain-containing protein [Halomonas sp. FME1]|uniref:DUF4236 domain-containing protein n=1 Tax=Halomonas casei TaxID=2742613 RepID=A0ABR9EY34_9GAMM|nr:MULTISPECIES: DUF4236 domain-containing protein [Halomonas]MBE0399009.1 DUF4236 domain-containing protein [Halomonas casei]PCC23005.1 hypothetical protein CIK78_13590 [Halomonas sp. JB37]
MGLKFRKSVKIAPGVRLNIGKKSSSVSLGSKYGGYNIGSKGTRARVSAPGTGLSYSDRIGKPRRQRAPQQPKQYSGTEWVVAAVVGVVFFFLLVWLFGW